MRCGSNGRFGASPRKRSQSMVAGLAPGELREGHDAEYLGAAQGAHSGVSAMPLDDPPKGLPWYELHDLREQRLAYVHASPQVAQTQKHRKSAKPQIGRPS